MNRIFTALLALSLLISGCQTSNHKESEIRLYIVDNGTIAGLDPALFNFTADEVAETDFEVTSYLIVHPQGTLLREAGALPDHDFPSNGDPAVEVVVRSTRSLISQLLAIGYAPEDIDYFAMSHLHSDHTANANEFAGSHWKVQKDEREAMFTGETRQIMMPVTFTALEHAQAIVLDNEDYDVFGDGLAMGLSP